MRIAISGTHCMGKSTLVEDFVENHPEYIHEIEPYHQLQEDHGAEFSEDLTLDCVLEQLDFSIDRLRHFSNQQNVIFDRCPLDFIAYAMAIERQEGVGIDESFVVERFPAVIEVVENLDLIAFLPLHKGNEIPASGNEDQLFRETVDKNFKKIYREDVFDLFPSHDHPHIIEIWGNPKERLEKLDACL